MRARLGNIIRTCVVVVTGQLSVGCLPWYLDWVNDDFAEGACCDRDPSNLATWLGEGLKYSGMVELHPICDGCDTLSVWAWDYAYQTSSSELGLTITYYRVTPNDTDSREALCSTELRLRYINPQPLLQLDTDALVLWDSCDSMSSGTTFPLFFQALYSSGYGPPYTMAMTSASVPRSGWAYQGGDFFPLSWCDRYDAAYGMCYAMTCDPSACELPPFELRPE